MSTLLQVIIYSLAGGLLSLIGGIALMRSKNTSKKLALYATPFAAGALLAAAFTDLLPEATKHGDNDTALLYALGGILLFFVLERSISWFHHHHDEDGHQHADATVPLIIIGDIIHNFIDGIAIAAGFLVDPSTGIVVTLAVAAHEIPQEIGDFGLLLNKGVSRKNVLKINVLSALVTTVAAVVFFTIGQDIELPLDIILGLVAGMFIYIATSDIIPSIHKTSNRQFANLQTLLLLIGVVTVGLATSYLHEYIDQDHAGHDHSHDEIYDEHDELLHEDHEDEIHNDQLHEDDEDHQKVLHLDDDHDSHL